MRIHWFQHVEFEGLGIIKKWINENNYELTKTALWKNESLPNTDEFDFLIIMGGPMNIYEYDKYPWLKEEKIIIKEAIDNKKIVLGICLGAQLISDVLGGKVTSGLQKEIGWYPLETFSTKNTLLAGIESKINVFHWHGDTFTVPSISKLLGRSDACKTQAFQFNDRVLALQFHLEMTKDSIDSIIENSRHELVKDSYVQTEEEVMKLSSKYLDSSNEYMYQILENIKSL